MNQILVVNNNINYTKNLLIKNKFYLFLFFFSISIGIVLSFNFIYSHFNRISNLQETNMLKNKYNIGILYTNNTNYTSLTVSNNISVIGSIEITKINISYPIIEKTNKDLLKISLCRYSGPLPNRIGNLCIAGHNYNNNTFFSNLHKLNIGDFFYITDLNNTELKYTIYEKFVVKDDNLNCIQDTNDIQVTLITCYKNNNSQRLIIKAKMEG